MIGIILIECHELLADIYHWVSSERSIMKDRRWKEGLCWICQNMYYHTVMDDKDISYDSNISDIVSETIK